MTIHRKLDTRPDRIDPRDRRYLPPPRSLAREFPPPGLIEEAIPLYLQHGMILDQGDEGACTGFGLAANINALLWRRKVLVSDGHGGLTVDPEAEPPAKVSPRMLFHLARFYDEWPGEDYQGSSCRGAIKAWSKHGVCREEIWPFRNPATGRAEFVAPAPEWKKDAAERPLGVYYRIDRTSITDMQAAIQEVGGIYCSAMVHGGWEVRGKGQSINHDALPVIPWANNRDGGGRRSAHAFSLVGYNRHGFIVQNSWGIDWGLKGFAVLRYDDWLANGIDAWVCVLGVPQEGEVPGVYVPSTRQRKLDNRGPGEIASWSLPFGFNRTREGGDGWTLEQAYLHSVVMGNEGKLISHLPDLKDGRAALQKVVVENAMAFFDQARIHPPRILIYAHGGLNTEGDSVKRIRAMGPYLEGNGIYPVFFTWKTGLLDSIINIIQDNMMQIFPQSGGALKDDAECVGEAKDRFLEVVCENLAKNIWTQMKQNAAAAARRGNNDRGVFQTTLALKKLKAAVPEVEIHFVGHSAGAILLGHMLDDFPRNKLKLNSCTLYAPACTVDFALRHYQKAIVTHKLFELDDLHIHLLDDTREKQDNVKLYGKSLLYLVSRALEEQHKTPILGLHRVFDPEKTKSCNGYDWWHPSTLKGVRKWQDFWGGRKLEIIDTDKVPTVARWRNGKITHTLNDMDANHGSFDNNVQVVSDTLRRITGKRSLRKPVENLNYD